LISFFEYIGSENYYYQSCIQNENRSSFIFASFSLARLFSKAEPDRIKLALPPLAYKINLIINISNI